MIVNLNTLCKVKLNDLGKVIWMSQIDSLPEEAKHDPQIIANIKNKIDKDGYVELELWGIMNLFGPYISPIKSPFETTTIEITKNPNFGNYFSRSE